jgi:hypothetical protein
MQNLIPIKSPTFSISVTATSSTPIALPGVGTTVRVVNEGANNAYLATGATAAEAVALVPTGTSSIYATPILAGEDCAFSRNPDTDLFIAAITSTSTTTLRVTVTEGV